MARKNPWKLWTGTGFPRQHNTSVLLYRSGKVTVDAEEELNLLVQAIQETTENLSEENILEAYSTAFVTWGEASGSDEALVYGTPGKSYTWAELIVKEL